jgi:hypothetical protein
VKEDVLSILVHGDSKVGKSTFTSTAPLPILVIDAEGSWKFIREAGFHSGTPLRKTTWDPSRPPPRHDGTWDVCVVSVTDWTTVERIWQWLTQGEHDFVSIVIDSITEMQRRLKLNIAGDGVIKGYDGWGALLARMDQKIRGFRDLTLAPGPVHCVVFVSETKERNGRYAPAMQGQIADQLPYWVDICGYMYQSTGLGDDGATPVKLVNLWIAPHQSFVAGERVAGLLPDLNVNPNLTDMLRTLYPHEENIDG